MADDYWLILYLPRFRYIPWWKEMVTFRSHVDFDVALDYLEKIRREHPDTEVKLGVTRGDTVYIIR